MAQRKNQKAVRKKMTVANAAKAGVDLRSLQRPTKAKQIIQEKQIAELVDALRSERSQVEKYRVRVETLEKEIAKLRREQIVEKFMGSDSRVNDTDSVAGRKLSDVDLQVIDVSLRGHRRVVEYRALKRLESLLANLDEKDPNMILAVAELLDATTAMTAANIRNQA